MNSILLFKFQIFYKIWGIQSPLIFYKACFIDIYSKFTRPIYTLKKCCTHFTFPFVNYSKTRKILLCIKSNTYFSENVTLMKIWKIHSKKRLVRFTESSVLLKKWPFSIFYKEFSWVHGFSVRFTYHRVKSTKFVFFCIFM